ncbi:MAG: putative transporter [Gammaproteobacteria bacterium]|nr:putative transporter [Gammaproteobacteria bacterium]
MLKSFFYHKKWMWWSYGGLALLVGLILITVQQTVSLNAWRGEFYNLLQKPDIPNGLDKFWGFMQQFAMIAFPFMLLRSLENYLASHYAFRWRQALTTDYLQRWQKVFGHIEGASQRIQEDCMRFAIQTESLGLAVARACLTLISFIPILWVLSAKVTVPWLPLGEGSLFWLALVTALGGTVISWFVGTYLPGLEYKKQRAEAAFRKQLVYAEDDRPKIDFQELLTLFLGVRSVNFKLYNHYAYFALWGNFYNQLMIIFPYLLMGPYLFTGVITLGVLTQVSDAFGRVNDSFSLLIDRWTDITELRSIYRRLYEFEQLLDHETSSAD